MSFLMVSITSISVKSAIHFNFIDTIFVFSVYSKPSCLYCPTTSYIICPVTYTLFYRSLFYSLIFL